MSGGARAACGPAVHASRAGDLGITWKRATIAALITFAGSSTSLTIAASARADTVAPRRVVVVHVNGGSGGAEETAALEATVRELLARLQLTMATGSAPASSVLETVTIDQSSVGAKVVVKSASGATILDRFVRGESPAIQREQIAHAVRGAAEAELLVDADRVAGRAPAVVEEPPAAPAPQPAPAPEPPPPPAPSPVLIVAVTPPVIEAPVAPPKREGSGIGLDVSTFAGGGGFANDTSIVAKVGGAVSVASRRGLRPQVTLAALHAFPFETGDENITARTSLFSLRLMPGVTVLRRGWFGVDTLAGGGLDVVSVDPVSSRLPEERLGDSTTRVNAIISGAVTARAEVASDVSVTLTALLDIDPSSRTYVFDNQGARSEVFAPWQVRPMLLAGISFAALGGGR